MGTDQKPWVEERTQDRLDRPTGLRKCRRPREVRRAGGGDRPRRP